MKRRTFLGALAAIPIVGWLVKPKKAEAIMKCKLRLLHSTPNSAAYFVDIDADDR